MPSGWRGLIGPGLESQIKDLRAKIVSQFSDLRQCPYRLSAVFIHRGSTNAGHYWIYIYDFKAKLWRSYNDEKVTLVTDVREIFDPPKGQRPPTPYFLVYVTDDEREALVDPICRKVTEAPPEEAEDVPMEQYEPIELEDPISSTYAALQPSVVSSGPSGEVGWDDSQQKDFGGW